MQARSPLCSPSGKDGWSLGILLPISLDFDPDLIHLSGGVPLRRQIQGKCASRTKTPKLSPGEQSGVAENPSAEEGIILWKLITLEDGLSEEAGAGSLLPRNAHRQLFWICERLDRTDAPADSTIAPESSVLDVSRRRRKRKNDTADVEETIIQTSCTHAKWPSRNGTVKNNIIHHFCSIMKMLC